MKRIAKITTGIAALAAFSGLVAGCGGDDHPEHRETVRTSVSAAVEGDTAAPAQTDTGTLLAWTGDAGDILSSVSADMFTLADDPTDPTALADLKTQVAAGQALGTSGDGVLDTKWDTAMDSLDTVTQDLATGDYESATTDLGTANTDMSDLSDYIGTLY